MRAFSLCYGIIDRYLKIPSRDLRKNLASRRALVLVCGFTDTGNNSFMFFGFFFLKLFLY